MSQIREENQLKYFISYAGSCLKIWRSIIGQQITHCFSGPGTIVDIEKNGDGISIKIQFHMGREPIPFRGTEWNLLRVFTHLTLPSEVAKELQARYWNIEKQELLNQLRDLASRPSIDRSTFDALVEVYDQLMRLHRTRRFPEQTLNKIIGYRQKFMDERQKLIDRDRFCNLSTQAMNPNVTACFSLPKLDQRDLWLVEEWCEFRKNTLNRTSLIKTCNKDPKLGRLFSARAAEKVAVSFYQHYGKRVKDISITQIYKNSNCDWKHYDLDIDGLHLDVKNSRESWKNPDRYTDHYIQKKFRYNKESQDVIIVGVFSPRLWTFELLDKPVEHHQNREVQFLGETTWKRLQVLKNEFKDSVDFEVPNPTGKYLLPPWVFEYPKYVYTDRDKTLKELRDFPKLDSLKESMCEFNLIPVCIAAGIDLTQSLGSQASKEWEQSFLNQLRSRVEKDELSLPFLFLSILAHFCDMAMYPKKGSDFNPDKYRRFLFCKEHDKPLGIFDPLKTVDALIKALTTLWTAKNELIRKFHAFKLKSSNILQGISNSNGGVWTTLIAYCGECGADPLVLGESKSCQYGKLICPNCRFCCNSRCGQKTYNERGSGQFR